ncbi:hypothetical protein B0H67DRAFT_560750 [Lasiosphaeris hirsuta]|uniref:Uncharacterized protein n=1 Tax=Lasiosphaeris hirsuta TaxID=260670 RepID=A0AA40EAI2_9PEZI|nr:hypothetical protein B0H67DRAFT_560750 [Lasiosphaeris hirsuta]
MWLMGLMSREWKQYNTKANGSTTFEAAYVLHRGAEPRDILYDSGSLMVVDFERAEYRGRQSRLNRRQWPESEEEA